MQPKLDGHRVLLVVSGEVRALNRKGDRYTRGLPTWLEQDLLTLCQAQTWVLDGELVNGKMWLFDVLVAFGADVTRQPYEFRLQLLTKLLTNNTSEHLRQTPTAWTPEEKLDLVRTVLDQCGEGVIVKDLRGLYLPGKRVSVMLKAKFEKTADCVVMAVKVDGKDNMVLGLYKSDGTLIEVAHCTALAGDGATIVPGMVVEVKYLYAVDPKKPRLYQPTYPKIRTDKAPSECLLSQLQYSSRTLQL